ncbi:MAG: PadR family transcriptional regulator [Clostridia bacterium]
MENPNTEIFRSRIDIFVLNAINQHDGYGYDILDYISNQTEGHYEMKQSSIYNVLKRLETNGYVTSYQGDASKGGKRKYYKILDKGKEFLESEKKEWEYSRTLIDNLVSEKTFDLLNEDAPFEANKLRPLTTRKTTEDSEEQIENVDKDALIVNTNNVVNNDAKPTNVSPNNDIGAILPNSNKNVNNPKKEEIAATDSSIVKENIYSNKSTNNYTKEQVFFTTSNNENSDSQDDILENWDIKKYKVPQEKIKPIDESYKAIFEDIFDHKKNAKSEFELDEDSAVDCKHITDLKDVLNSEGYDLNKFKSTPNKNYMRYIYTTKLYRDVGILTYLFYVLMLLTLFLAKSKFAPNNVALLTFGCVGVILPIITLVNYLINPNKRKKDNIKLNVLVPVCFFIYFIFLLLNIIIELLIPNGLSINSPQIYAPSIVALVIPFFGLLYLVLCKSGMYYQKVK